MNSLFHLLRSLKRPKTPIRIVSLSRSCCNAGDQVTKDIFDYLRIPYQLTNVNRPKTFFGCGSLLYAVKDNDVVWGAGFSRQAQTCGCNAKFLAVRGPVSYRMLRERGVVCNPVIGDPALILPRLYQPRRPSQLRKRGFVMHVVEYQQPKLRQAMQDEFRHVISPTTYTVWDFIDELVKYREIYSSSLHGVILAHAYGIPATWVKISNILKTDGTKFQDYYESVGLDVPLQGLKEKPRLPRGLDVSPLVAKLVSYFDNPEIYPTGWQS